MTTVSVRRPVLIGAVAGAPVMFLMVLVGIRGAALFVPLFVAAAVGLEAARQGAPTHTALAAGVGAAFLCAGIVVAVVLVFLVGAASGGQPGLGDRVLAFLVAAAGVVVLLRSAWPVAGVVIIAAACLVLVPPLGRPIELQAGHRPAPGYPPTARNDPRRSVPLSGGSFSLSTSKIFYINGEGGYPTHRLLARWRPPLGLVPEERKIADLCGTIDDPCPRWFIGGEEQPVEHQQGLALEREGDDAVLVRVTRDTKDAPAYAVLPTAWTVTVGPWQWWRGAVWLALLALGVWAAWRGGGAGSAARPRGTPSLRW